MWHKRLEPYLFSRITLKYNNMYTYRLMHRNHKQNINEQYTYLLLFTPMSTYEHEEADTWEGGRHSPFHRVLGSNHSALEHIGFVISREDQSGK